MEEILITSSHKSDWGDELEYHYREMIREKETQFDMFFVLSFGKIFEDLYPIYESWLWLVSSLKRNTNEFLITSKRNTKLWLIPFCIHLLGVEKKVWKGIKTI